MSEEKEWKTPGELIDELELEFAKEWKTLGELIDELEKEQRELESKLRDVWKKVFTLVADTTGGTSITEEMIPPYPGENNDQ